MSVEDRVINTFWSDGLLDILIGVGIVLIGISWENDLVVMGAVAPALLVPIWKPLREKLIIPRLGFVSLTKQREQKNKNFLISMFAMGLIFFIAGIGFFYLIKNNPNITFNFIAGLPAILIATPMLAISFAIKSGRFVFYFTVFLTAGTMTIYLNEKPGLGMGIAGLVVLLTGLFKLLKFIKDHRHIEED